MARFKKPYPEFDSDDRNDMDFWQAHCRNPRIYRLYTRLAWVLKRAQQPRGSSEQIIQRLRWEVIENPRKHRGFKIKNIYRRRYAKMLAHQDPKNFGKFFRFVKNPRRGRRSR